MLRKNFSKIVKIYFHRLTEYSYTYLLVLNENIPSSNDYATNYSWVGYQQIKVFEEVKPIKIIQQFSAMDHLFVVEGQDYIKQSAISLSNSEEPMLLKVELALDSALTYYSYVLNGFETHYTEFKKICP